MSRSPLDSDISLPYPKLIALAQNQPEVLKLRRAGTAVHKPIFVVGCPRSGTTVLGACLAAHPQLAGSGESLFLLDCWRIANDLHAGNNHQGWAPLANYVSSQELLEAIGAFCDAMIVGLLRKTCKNRYVDHTPWYVACLPFIVSLYPDCTIVHLLRDGRYVVASLRKSFERGFAWAGRTIAESADLWSSLVISGLNDGRALPRDNYIDIRYEQLVLDPEACLRGLLRKMGLPWDDRVLLPLATPHATLSTSFAPLAKVLEDGSLKLLPRCDSRDWPASWSADEKTAFVEVAGYAMACSGYFDYGRLAD